MQCKEDGKRRSGNGQLQVVRPVPFQVQTTELLIAISFVYRIAPPLPISSSNVVQNTVRANASF